MLNIDKGSPVATATVEELCAAPHLDPRGTAARRGALMSAEAVRNVADTFRILGDPTRIRILDALSGGELCVCDIAGLAAISESAVSHQLRLLRGMRLVKSHRAGRLVFYALDDQHIIELLRQAHTHVEETA
jgi:DNA-binding transcriptional ArsR family regulator